MASVGDSYDNALAEAFNSLFKAELIRARGPGTGIGDLEVAGVEYIDWFNRRCLHGELGHVTPAEHEAAPYRAAGPPASLRTTSSLSLHETRGLTAEHVT
ncbi:integrase core domain-containing protein [Streptomyces sp. GD-15H]|uniref:integrase core domain-containing protein n=1 Tax=Streptomyces sp. GD-15H TaxID=3129112 RepID=UPI003243F932